MNLSQTAAGAAVSAIGALLNSGTAVIYQGVMPASPETALSGDTSLATLTFASTAFGAPTYVSPNMQAAASFTASSISPTTAGLANFCRLFETGGTAVADLICIAPYNTAPVFTPPVGFRVTAGGNSYAATTVTGPTAGTTPTGTTTSTDGGVTWTYLGAGTLGDAILGGSVFQTSTPITNPTMLLKVAAV